MTFDSLRGPYTLNDPLVDQQTRRGPGVYLLGCQSADGRFRVQSIGCADDNLNAALKDRIGRYPQFKYLHLESRDAALACHREVAEAICLEAVGQGELAPPTRPWLRRAVDRVAGWMHVHPRSAPPAPAQ